MTLDLSKTRTELVEYLATEGFSLQTAAGADFSRDGNDPKGSDVEFSIGTVYGEVSILAKANLPEGKWDSGYTRITHSDQIGDVLLKIHMHIRLANERGRIEGWL